MNNTQNRLQDLQGIVVVLLRFAFVAILHWNNLFAFLICTKSCVLALEWPEKLSTNGHKYVRGAASPTSHDKTRVVWCLPNSNGSKASEIVSLAMKCVFPHKTLKISLGTGFGLVSNLGRSMRRPTRWCVQRTKSQKGSISRLRFRCPVSHLLFISCWRQNFDCCIVWLPSLRALIWKVT